MEKNHNGRSSQGTPTQLSKFMGPLLISAVAFWGLYLTFQMDSVSAPGQLGPFFWPKAILVLLVVSCGIKAMEVLFASSPGGTSGAGEPTRPEIHYSRLLTLIFLVFGVVLATEILGFPSGNFLFLLLFMYAAGIRKKFYLVFLSLLGTLALLYLFVKIVYLPLPKGYWFFEDFTLSLYRILRFI